MKEMADQHEAFVGGEAKMCYLPGKPHHCLEKNEDEPDGTET